MIDFFYSDPHFAHKNIIQHSSRPFSSVEDMHQFLIDAYRRTVGPNHMVLWTGDCSWDFDLLKLILSDLPGRKGLVRGNHDKSSQKMATVGFDFVVDELVLDLCGVPGLVSHYPPKNAKDVNRAYDIRYLDRRPVPQKGTVVIHGHTHESAAIFKNDNGGYQKRIHVGVDAWDFSPAPFSSVVALAHTVTRR